MKTTLIPNARVGRKKIRIALESFDAPPRALIPVKTRARARALETHIEAHSFTGQMARALAASARVFFACYARRALPDSLEDWLRSSDALPIGRPAGAAHYDAEPQRLNGDTKDPTI